jgi:cytochrome c-type biogenesis protein
MEPQHQAGWIVAIVAGFLSFVSPCVLPLIPGYLSMISGLSAEQLEARRGRDLARVFVSCVLFAVGFGVVFVLVGASAGAVGSWLGPRIRILNVVFGIIVIIFGLFVLNVVKLPFLYQDRRLRLTRRSVGMWSAPLLGVAFGLGWTPCVGPWLGTLYGLAASRSTGQAALLFAIYSASLGACFVAAGMLFASALRAFAFLQRHYRVIEVTSGGLLIVIGVLLLTQQWDKATGRLIGLLG